MTVVHLSMLSAAVSHFAQWLVAAALSATLALGLVAAGADAGAGGDGGSAPAGGSPGEGGEGTGDGDGDGSDRQDGGEGDEPGRRSAGREGTGDGDPDEDDDDEDYADVPDEVRNNPRFKNLRTRHRKLQRQFGRINPIAMRFRGSDGQVMGDRDIDALVGRARDMEELEQLFDEHPDLVGQILERKNRGRRPAEGAAEEFVDPFANEADIPWDTEQPAGRALVDHLRRGARENFELRQKLGRVEQLLQQFGQNDQKRQVAQVESRWKDATVKASRDLPQEYRNTFVNSVYRAFRLAAAEKRLHRVDVHRLIDEELKPYRQVIASRKRTDVAGKQRTAESNRNLPAPQRRGQPANPQETNRSETIRDGRKSFFARIGRRAPVAGR